MDKIDSDKRYVMDIFSSFIFTRFTDDVFTDKVFLNNKTDIFDKVIYDFLIDASSRKDDKRYIEKMKKSFYFFNVLDKHFFIQLYMKLFLIGLMYNCNKDNYFNYSVLVDDIMAIKFPKFFRFSNDFSYYKIINCMSVFFNNKNYSKIDELRKMLRGSDGIFSNKLKMAEFVLKCSELKLLETMTRKFDISNLVDEVNNDSVITLSNSIIKGEIDLTLIPDMQILLLGNRYSYFFNKLNEVETNPNIKNFYISCLGKLNLNMFDEMNKDSDTDSFIECMDIVFDSDSYFELDKKLRALKMASNDYEGDRKASAFALIKNLASYSCKEVYMEKEVSYPNNTMNLISKPKRIIDRMKYLYSKIDGSMSYDFLDSVYSSCNDFNSLIPLVYEKIDKKKGTFIYKVKKKVNEQKRK